MKEIITDAQVLNIRTKIEAELKNQGVVCGNLQEDSSKELRIHSLIQFVTDQVSGETLGNFKFVIADYRILVLVWIKNDFKHFVAQPVIRYRHPDGGRNGHDMNFTILGSVDGSEVSVESRQN